MSPRNHHYIRDAHTNLRTYAASLARRTGCTRDEAMARLLVIPPHRRGRVFLAAQGLAKRQKNIDRPVTARPTLDAWKGR